MAQSKIKERGETWQSCNTHCSWAYTSEEKLEYSTKSNIECNSGISKDIWCHKYMYYYIWLYKYIFFSVLLCFIFIVVYGGVMIVFKKCYLVYRKYFCFCWTNCCKTLWFNVYIPCICMSAVYSLQNIIWKCKYYTHNHTNALTVTVWASNNKINRNTDA